MSEVKLLDYVISYPKSGRTWFRYMYDRYLQELYGFPGGNIFEVEKGSTYYYKPIWTHLECDVKLQRTWHQVGIVDPRVLEGKTCLIITRNIPDTLVSLYYHLLYRTDLNFNGSISDFIRNPALGALKIGAFYDVVNNFLPLTKAIKVRYEDLHAGAKKRFRHILKFLGHEVKEHIISKVVNEATFENMKKLGSSQQYYNTWMAPTDYNNPQSNKIRSGRVGESKELFSQEDLDYIQTVSDIVLGYA